MSQSLQEIYKRRVAEGGLCPDPAQMRVLTALDGLQKTLLKKPSPLKRLLPFLFSRTRGKYFISPPHAGGQGGEGAYIHGPVGRGKTMLMDLFYQSIPDCVSKRRVHFHDFMIEVHDYFHSRRSEDYFVGTVDGLLPSLAALIAARSKILCFDEFHVTDVADAMILGRLFTTLFDHGVIVVMTSNWPPDDLYKGGLQRDRFLPFIALLKARLQILPLMGSVDYRTQFLQDSGSYFYPLNAESRRRADKVFAVMTDHAAPAAEHIHVKGRDIVVPAATRHAARFSFADLCAAALGAEDYRAIAQRFKIVFIDEVPLLGDDNRNEAKRFMTLIDVFYDHKTQIVLNADAPADRLYNGSDYAFEFQRTASRLREMQSRSYASLSSQ